MRLAKLKSTGGHLLAGVFAAVILVSGFAPETNAAPPCGPHEKVTAALEKKYKELRKGIGLVSNKNVAEVFVSDTGSWTFIVTYVNGMSCIVATGHSWEDAPKVASVGPGI